MRNARPGTPPTASSAQPRNGSASAPGASAATTARARGPATATCAHWSVTGTIATSSSGHRHSAQNSRWLSTSPAAAVVVVTRNRSPSRATVPSSSTKPSSRSITP